MAERSIFLVLILASYFYFFSNPCYSETDTLIQGKHLTDWDEVVSSNKVFNLKFFDFGSSISPYLGIFYRPVTSRTYGEDDTPSYYSSKPVWVANRNNPITDRYGELVIDVHGKLSILSGGGTVVDLFNPPNPVTRNASARLLDNGNLVLQELNPDGSLKRVLWQSFDYPTDTLLPGMKVGINLKTGHRWSLTSWRSEKEPADGSFTFTADPNGTSQMVILRRGNIHWRSGSWQNGGFENTALQYSGRDVHIYYISNETEQSFTYLTKTYDSLPDVMMDIDGRLYGPVLKLDVRCRKDRYDVPGCAEYEYEELSCRKNCDDFRASLYGYMYGDEYEYDANYNLTLYDCQRLCWTNCSCMAFTYETTNATRCKTYGQSIYNPAEADNRQYREYQAIWCYDGDYGENEEKKKMMWIWLIVVSGSLALLLACFFVYKKLQIRLGEAVKGAKLFVLSEAKKIRKLMLQQLRRFYNYLQRDKKMNTELHHFTFQSISSATNNFSSTNKLGEGGFGAVYKGKLADGQEVAVKRLSTSSEQGVKEFRNETELIAKLQHTNLVRLIGCCIEKKEKILVYEYMPNKSLDSFLFDPRKKGLLDWNARFVIIDGIAQGLLYLHRFSRLRVIHRDLKASNILLDDYLKPKISDFGMAKLFGINESEANTSRVVGTRGYMPPEYMLEGSVSTKTDVYGFGVLLLEIVSSKMNHGSYDAEHPLNLLGLAWELWNEGKGLELMDPVLEDCCTPKEVMTCIHVGLLCVQDNAMDRPTMSEVISMLTNENMHLPEPKRPAFFIERHETDSTKEDNFGNGSTNRQSISILVAR